jgi:hypothetical protein
MEDDLREHLEKLERTVAELERVSKRALGFVSTIEYRGIAFNVGKRFVIADLSPLAFFHLVEHIHTSGPNDSPQNGIEAAVIRLYDRLGPLLTCRHDWTLLKREDDERMRAIVGIDKAPGVPGPYICKSCTAYALGAPLPFIGRSRIAPDAGL